MQCLSLGLRAKAIKQMRNPIGHIALPSRPSLRSPLDQRPPAHPCPHLNHPRRFMCNIVPATHPTPR